MERPLLIVSNRGPVSFVRDANGAVVARRGAGGLVSGLAPLVAGTSTIWLAAAITEGDRAVATGTVVDIEGFRVCSLALDAEDYRLSYDVVCNATLWFTHHELFALAHQPSFDGAWWEAWQAHRRVNARFAEVIADVAPQGAVVLVQDYHLTLLAAALGDTRPDLRMLHFSHTPFAGPDGLRVLPPTVRTELLAGMAAHHARVPHPALGQCLRGVLRRDPREAAGHVRVGAGA
ncbi:MAG: trehalose-6-phosphate synthase [Acidimicrobiales bacterium]